MFLKKRIIATAAVIAMAAAAVSRKGDNLLLVFR